MHAKVGDFVRTASGRRGRIAALRARLDGGWIADVEVECSDARPAVLPYDADDLTVVRSEQDSRDGALAGRLA